MGGNRIRRTVGAADNVISGAPASIVGAKRPTQLEIADVARPLGGPRFALTQGDAFAWLRALWPESVDCVVTDPPYESLEKHRAHGTTTRLTNEWFPTISNDLLPELFRQFYRVLRRSSHCYMYCDAETMFHAKPAGEAMGFKFWKPIIWDKKRIGMGYHYRSRYECILFFEKGKRRLNNLGVPDIIEEPRVHGGYPTEKPVRVSRILIEQSTQPGDLVVDPFMGSGSVGDAALMVDRRFMGCDISHDAHALATARLEAVAGAYPCA